MHALYNTPQFWTLDGKTTTQWTLDWARNLIENAPHPQARLRRGISPWLRSRPRLSDSAGNQIWPAESVTLTLREN